MHSSGKDLLTNNRKRHISLFKTLRRGESFIDCGANTGQEIDIVFKTGATVHAFEPNPYAFAILLKKYPQYPRIHLYNKAVHDHFSEMRSYLHERSDEDPVKWSTGSSLLDFKQNVRSDQYVEIEVIDLIEFIERVGSKCETTKNRY